MALELSKRYQSVLRSGDFQSLLSKDPWPHFVLDNLLPTFDFERVQMKIEAEEPSFRTIEDHPAKLQLSYLPDLELAKFFFSPLVRRLFEGIAREALVPNTELAIQLRRMTPDSPAFPPHVDLIERPSLVVLYYLSQGWSASRGGEIILLKDESSDPKGSDAKRIAPIANRALLFMSAGTHWHCVEPVRDWTRLTVLTEWLPNRREAAC